MAKIYDITSKLDIEKPIIKLGGKDFEVNDNHKLVILIQNKISTLKDEEAFSFVFEKLLGKEAAKEIENMNLSFKNIKIVFLAVMAAASGEELEVVEERFQKQINK